MSSKFNTVTAADAVCAIMATKVGIHHRAAIRASCILDRSPQLAAAHVAMAKARRGIDTLYNVITPFASSQPLGRFSP